MKMTGMKVTSASVSGSRLIRAMLRFVSTHTSPPHAAGIGLDRAAGGLGQAEPLERLIGAAPGGARGQPAELADHDQVGAAGEVLVERRVLPGQADPPPHLGRLRHHVAALDPRRPAPSGRRSVAKTRTAVVLPTLLRILCRLTRGTGNRAIR